MLIVRLHEFQSVKATQTAHAYTLKASHQGHPYSAQQRLHRFVTGALRRLWLLAWEVLLESELSWAREVEEEEGRCLWPPAVAPPREAVEEVGEEGQGLWPTAAAPAAVVVEAEVEEGQGAL
eukprot:jgi/Ulvmu1/3131/UM015_0171.1